MNIADLTGSTGHERVLLAEDASRGYRGIIAIHSTRLGPAVGGTRAWRYLSQEEALTDALRLSRGMTYKNAAAGLPLGGGKSVILLDGRAQDRRELFLAHGEFVEHLGGEYITAEDVGSSPADMATVREVTSHVAGLATRSGDPSPVTAHGVFRGMQATMMSLHGSSSLSGKTVAVQGVGNVGYHLAGELHRAGARLVVADPNVDAVARCVREFGAGRSRLDAIHAEPADIFAPCALGGTLNARTIGELRVRAVVGAANNQLAAPGDADLLAKRGVVYAPDYIVNAGGVINGSREILGWSAERAASQVEAIYDTLLGIFRAAAEAGITTAQAADRLAERRLTTP